MYLWWKLYTAFPRMPGGVTVGDSGLCCCVPCLSSALISVCLSSLHKSCKPHSVSDYNTSLCGQRVNGCMCVCVCVCLYVEQVSRSKDYVRSRIKIGSMPVHTCVAECAWNGWYIWHWGHSFFCLFWGCTCGGVYMPSISCTPGGVTVGDSGLCCCVPCLSNTIISLCLLIKLSSANCIFFSFFFFYFFFFNGEMNAALCSKSDLFN